MRYVVCFSGGVDSATLLYLMASRGEAVEALSFDYGQKHRKELDYAAALCKLAGVPHRLVNVTGVTSLFHSSLVQGGEAIPEGHYAADNMKSTVVPNRNAIMLGICAARAYSIDATGVACAVHAGDHAIYPDCRPEFIASQEQTLRLSLGSPEFCVYAPFVHMDKTAIVKLGAQLGVPYELTWSCYKGGEFHCGKCGTCVERKEAFKLAGVVDPTEYEQCV